MADSLVQPPDLAGSRAELEAVLASPSFTRAPAVSKILAYVCNKHLDGAGDTVNEWSIAVDALGRRQTFDPEKDSIVRVEFHFLRKRLADYYQKEGASHALRITFGESGYVPRFVSTVPAAPVIAEEPPGPEPEPPVIVAAEPQVMRWRKVALPGAVAAAVLVAIGGVSLWKPARTNPTAALASGTPTPLISFSPEEAIRIAAGMAGPKYVDSSGHIWSGDTYVTGGAAFDRSDRKIFRTLDAAMYQKGREGEFRYDIPARSGFYELRLHFAETRFGQTPLEGADAMRRFDVSLNGNPLLEDFDITRDAAGPNTATVKIWKDVAPGPDGFVRLNFYGRSGRPLLNAIELVPSGQGKPLPVRLVCGVHPVYDREGRFWQADAYFLGGRIAERQSVYEAADDLGLYTSARFGNFNYAIPVAAGETYRATMRFADHNSQAAGDRVFDVLSNGAPLLTSFDILKRAGGPNRATVATFRGLKPNPQGKLIFDFIPRRDYAAVHAIEIEAERD